MRVLTGAEVIARAQKLHDHKYSYEDLRYVNKRTKVVICCPQHGNFQQLPLAHAVKGAGCPKCGIAKVSLGLTCQTPDFIRKARAVHGDRYAYENTQYKTCMDKVLVTCHVHGDFEVAPTRHVLGHGCGRCGTDAMRSSQDHFIALCRQRHGDRYNYDKALYVRGADSVTIICPDHGEFQQQAAVHSTGHGCPKCMVDLHRKSHAEFIADCRRVHGDTFDYSLTEYVAHNQPVKIICRVHGLFLQTATLHISGSSCPKCVSKRFSKVSIEWLNYRALQDGVYIQHAMNDGEYSTTAPDGRRLHFDGYSAETNTVYEFLGEMLSTILSSQLLAWRRCYLYVQVTIGTGIHQSIPQKPYIR